MKTTEEILEWILQNAMEADPNGSLVYSRDIFNITRYCFSRVDAVCYFLAANPKNTGPYLTIQEKFVALARKHFGPDVNFVDRSNRLAFKLAIRWDFFELAYVTPSQTKILEDWKAVDECILGVAKLAFRRDLPYTAGLWPFWHTGVCLRRKADKGVDLNEVRVQASKRVSWTERNDAEREVTTNDKKEFLIDDTLLPGRGQINVGHLIYRLAATCDLKFRYN